MKNYERLRQDHMMEKKILRVGAYCRVSTDREDQSNSFESQQRYFKEYIERNPEWELAEVFADEGISGTSTKKRKAFNKMIECAKAGDLDLIITKEISRFARNTLDSIFYTRELKRIGVGVIFLNDNINTLEPDAELRLTIMSSIAQEESRKTSDRVKWGQKRRMEQGIVFGRNMLGYDINDGQMTINEEGAKIVRLIFHKFANENKGTQVIARELREEGYKTISGNVYWSNTMILKVIRNEKYCGDLVQKKTFTPDYLTHEKKYNRGEEEFVIIKNHHEPIVSREIFEQANEILDSRALSQEGKAKHSNRYAFSGKIKCGTCGSTYVARYKTLKSGHQTKSWRCYNAARHGSPHLDKAGNQVGCSNESIRNEDAAYIMSLVVKSLDLDRETLIKNLMDSINSVITTDVGHVKTENLSKKITDIEGQQARLIEIFMGGNITKDEFLAAREKSDVELANLREMLESLEKQDIIVRNYQTLMKDIEEAFCEMLEGASCDDIFYRQILNKMVVHDRDNIDVYLNILPEKWSYTVAKASKKAEASECDDSGASLFEASDTLAEIEVQNDKKVNFIISYHNIPTEELVPFDIQEENVSINYQNIPTEELVPFDIQEENVSINYQNIPISLSVARAMSLGIVKRCDR